ncbi:MAG: hypothetical protein G3M70_10970 [Candidatus Nitronauta litoralis]|uniref:Glycosyl transferase family 3 N-terminal domain-containing protein n=1 Tax=Candidatus Nitronauta litoralis TaxID=2705533 RepID=A0A7T0G0A6_9BACT|nr:MAG: hypothetical protein G3M70_10970 [Candidatus Nitronauta litoralis]
MVEEQNPEKRMEGYLSKVATGPKMSKDLTCEEAEDGLTLILEGAVSPIRAALFLITTRMKLETIDENLGFWQALDKTTEKRTVPLETLCQVADAFDGFERQPYFGFYVIPLLGQMGFPAYGHSALPHPPKFGFTFEDILQNHYGIKNADYANRIQALVKYRFGYLGTGESHPELEALRELRREIVKRPMLATLEKMLMPLAASKNYLATNYFHPGYEVSMLSVAEASNFDRVIIGNGIEGSTLYGVHKKAKVFLYIKNRPQEEKVFDCVKLFGKIAGERILEAHSAMKETSAERGTIAEAGERALKGESHPALELIACQAATLLWLLDQVKEPLHALNEARALLQTGKVYDTFMSYLDELRKNT